MKKLPYIFIVLSVLLFACNSHEHNEHDHAAHGQEEHGEHAENEHEEHDGDEHEESIMLTAYSANFEVFAETHAFVVGEAATILSHFSHIPNFTALEAGIVSMKLIVGENIVDHKLDAPSRKGIYSFTLTPLVAGKGKIVYTIETGEGTYNVEVPGVEVFKSGEDARHAHEDEDVYAGANVVAFTKEQSWKIDFATEPTKLESFGQVIKTTGQVQSSQGDEIIVSAKINGILSLSNGNVLEGKQINGGEILFTISGKGMAKSNVAVHFDEVKNNYEKAKKDYERALKLAKDKIVSEKEMLEIETIYKNTKSEFDDHKNYFSASGQNVTSPMTGFVKQVFVQNGEYVEAGQPIIIISQNKSLLIRTEVQQKYANILAGVKTASIRTLQDNKVYSLHELNGKVLSFGRNTNTNNYLIPLSLQIANVGSFIPGGFVEVYLKTVSNAQALTIPSSALLEAQGIFFVFAQITPELFEKREVKTGATDGIRTEILSGLKQNERVVSKGAMLVKLSQAAGALDPHAGHVH